MKRIIKIYLLLLIGYYFYILNLSSLDVWVSLTTWYNWTLNILNIVALISIGFSKNIFNSKQWRWIFFIMLVDASVDAFNNYLVILNWSVFINYSVLIWPPLICVGYLSFKKQNY